jgi:DNA repair protein RecO (recombination protein O)
MVDFSDSSQVVSLFTREAGLLDGIAKGAHRPKSSFQGPFDLAVLYDVEFIDRRGRGLAILTEAEVLDGYRGLRRSWRRYVVACQAIELLRGVVVAAERTADLFDLACRAFEGFSEGPEAALGWSLLHFEVRTLALLGFLAAVETCVHCGREWPAGPVVAYYSPAAGGLFCRRCHRAERAAVERVAALSGAEVRVLRELSQTADGPPAARSESRVLRQLHGCVARSCTALLERPLRVLRYQSAWL